MNEDQRLAVAAPRSEIKLERTIQKQIRRLSARIENFQKISMLYSNVRLTIALAGIALITACFQFASNLLGWIMTAIVVASFCMVLYRHTRVKDCINRYRILLNFRITQIARMNLDWAHIPLVPATTVQAEHPFDIDLDITGERSLHQLLDVTISIGGSRKLRSWLIQTEPDLEEILKRQMLVKELSTLTLFRHKLIVNGLRACENPGERLDTRNILQWFNRRGSNSYSAKAFLPFSLLAVSNLVIFGMIAMGMVSPYFLALYLFYFVPILYFQIDIGKAFHEAVDMEVALDNFHKVCRHLEKYGYAHTPHLAELCSPFMDPRNRPSSHLRRVSRIVSGISIRSNPVVWMLLNGILPWDLFFIRRLDRCRKDISALITSWLNILTEVEALSSLANFACLNREYSYPELETGTPMHFSAEHLGHPLIPPHDRVCNSISLNESSRIALITGSNMAGKSSFLRTIGVNLCLAFAGSPVCAASLQTGLFRIFACMRINDSLTEGFSFFYAEVKRLRMLLTSVEANHGLPVLFLLDEIFRGTNNQERFIGSRAYVRAIVGRPTLGAIATHDLELVRLTDENKAITNYHFREEVDSGRMVFDYKLRPGPCPTTNALKIMAMAGLPV